MERWSEAAWSVWGKTEADPEKSPDWLPLVVHLTDSAGVGAHLWDRWLTPSQRQQISGAVGSPESGRALVAFLCGIHDLGKCSPAFAIKARHPPRNAWLLDEMGRRGLTIPRDLVAPLAPHGTVGQWAVQQFLIEIGARPRDATTFACVVGGHHGRHPSTAEVSGLRLRQHQTGDETWGAVRREIWDGIATVTGAEAYLAEWATRRLSPAVQVTLSGVVIMADWIASNLSLFPYGRPHPERLAQGLAQLDLAQPWSPSDVDSSAAQMLHSRFPQLIGRSPQPMQQATVEVAQSVLSPALMIVEAPMGSGKTEAALLAAELMAARFGLGGTFVGLPTMATANPMFARVEAWLRHVPAKAETSLNLVHGKAALNEHYRSFVRRSPMMTVYDDVPDGPGPSEMNAGTVYASSWCWGRKRAGLASHVVATIDQGLFADLRTKHVTLRQLALSGKVVVIDEVHAADDFMSVYLEGILTWLGSHQVPVILLSATLPPANRQRLADAYARGRCGRAVRVDLDSGLAYPRLTVVDDHARDVPVSPGSGAEVRVTVGRLGTGPDDVDRLLGELLADGGCAGVICNTVGRAQAVYGRLRETYGDETVLIHSKFAAPHRVQREADLVEQLGPRSTRRPGRLIVVGTQVLEQSLDIDFDVLVTDLAPVDLVLQRIGRLHRHRRGPGEAERPARLREARCFVMDGEPEDPTSLEPGARTIYRAHRLLACRTVLRGARYSISLPSDVPRLVRDAYAQDAPAPPGWEKEWAAAQEQEARYREGQQSEASGFRLEHPDQLGSLNGLVELDAGDPDGPSRGAARVRDTEESLEVVVVARDADGLLRALPGTGPLSGRVIPRSLGWGDDELARHIAACTVTLPGSLTRGDKALTASISALEDCLDTSGWQISPWLAGQLFLVLDAAGRAQVGPHVLAYDSEVGLRIEPPEPSTSR